MKDTNVGYTHTIAEGPNQLVENCAHTDTFFLARPSLPATSTIVARKLPSKQGRENVIVRTSRRQFHIIPGIDLYIHERNTQWALEHTGRCSVSVRHRTMEFSVLPSFLSWSANLMITRAWNSMPTIGLSLRHVISHRDPRMISCLEADDVRLLQTMLCNGEYTVDAATYPSGNLLRVSYHWFAKSFSILMVIIFVSFPRCPLHTTSCGSLLITDVILSLAICRGRKYEINTRFSINMDIFPN